MSEQIFLPRKLNFNLCEPKAQKATIIYAVVFFQGRQYKVNTGVKVCPSQWNKQKQLAVVSNCLSKLDNANNIIANEKISQIKVGYIDFLNYICEKPKEIGNFYEVLKRFINKDMSTRKKVKGLSFENEFRKLVSEMSETRQSKYMRLVEDFLTFMKDEAVAMEWSSITKEFLLRYACYMVRKTPDIQIRTFNDRVDNLFFLMNHADQHEYLTRYDKRRWSKFLCKLKDDRTDEEKQSVNVVLSDEQVSTFYEQDFDTPLKNEVKDIFTFLCLTGLSEGDLPKMWNEEFITWIDDRNIEIRRNKTGVQAVIPLTDERTKAIYDRYRQGFPYTKLKGKTRDGKITLTANECALLNSTLHQIIRESGFDYEIPVIRSYVACKENKIYVGKRKEMKHLADEITMYDSRHTFITSSYYKGMPIAQIIDIVGHTSSKMVESIYLKLDKRKEVEAKAKRNNEFYNNLNQNNVSVNISQGSAPMDYDALKREIIENRERGKEIEKQRRQIASQSQIMEIERQHNRIEIERRDEELRAYSQGFHDEYVEAQCMNDEIGAILDYYDEP